MIFTDYVIEPVDGRVLSCHTQDTATITPAAVALCRAARADVGAIERVGRGVAARWSEAPLGALSLNSVASGYPLCMSLLPLRPEPDALRQLLRLHLSTLRVVGIEPSPEWVSHIDHYPCVVTVPLPTPAHELHLQAIAGDLVRCWAAAWFLDSEVREGNDA